MAVTGLWPARPAADAISGPRRLGMVGALLLAAGALGAGALPVPNPLAGVRVLGLPSRNPTLALAVAYTGVFLIVVAWWRIDRAVRAGGPGAPRRGDLMRAGLSWAVPLALAPPLFSRDVYSYLAQGAVAARGLDPYRVGPVALGMDDPLTRSIPALWRSTPSPYGPLFTQISRAVTTVTGDDVVAGVLAQRGIALLGWAMVIWALPRLARRAGADPNRALWLGAANPLVLFHVVSGAHNDALMLGLMLAGLEIGLRATSPCAVTIGATVLTAVEPGTARIGRAAPPVPQAGVRAGDPNLLVGAALVVAGSAVKIPAALALGYLGLAWARARGGRIADAAVAAAVLTGVAIAVYLPLSLIGRIDLGWLATLDVPGSVLSYLSPTTDLALVTAWLGIFAGLGDHTAADLMLLHTAGTSLACMGVAATLVATLRSRRETLGLLAAGMTISALLTAATQPWYLLWALAPLAASPAAPRLRRALAGCALIVAVVVPPTGSDFLSHGYELIGALAATAALVAVVLLADRRVRQRVAVAAAPVPVSVRSGGTEPPAAA